jgi:hypothetical protein
LNDYAGSTVGDPDPYVFVHPGSASGTISQRYRSENTDPDPCPNVTDIQHRLDLNADQDLNADLEPNTDLQSQTFSTSRARSISQIWKENMGKERKERGSLPYYLD